MLLRRWIMEGLSDETPFRSPHEDQQDHEWDQIGRNLLRLLISGDRTAASEQDVEIVRRMLAIWRHRLQYRQNMLEYEQAMKNNESAPGSDALESQDSHTASMRTQSPGDRVICSCCRGRVTMTDSCVA
jgi:hypothetical protein